MKRTVLFIALCCIISGAAPAQQIKASPFEGSWVWNREGKEAPEFSEIIFFGNVILMAMGDMDKFYLGGVFSWSEKEIKLGDEIFFKYRLSGSKMLISMDTEEYTFTKSGAKLSPLQGIWKLSGGEDYDADEDKYMLFTGDIMAIGTRDIEEAGFVGFVVKYDGKTIYSASEEEDEMIMEYDLSGKSLRLNNGDEYMELLKVY